MKTKNLLLFMMLAIGVALLFTVNSCKKSIPADCYKAKIWSMDQSGCPDIIQIEKSYSENVPAGIRVSLGIQRIKEFSEKFQKGDIIYFKASEIVKHDAPGTTGCSGMAAYYCTGFELCK